MLKNYSSLIKFFFMKYFLGLILFCKIIVAKATAQPGTLDPSFGNEGIVIGEGYTGLCYASALQSDGKIIAGGDGGGFLLVRYNTDGSPDSSFGNAGRVVTSFFGLG